MGQLMALCRKIIEYHKDGTPIKDAIEPSEYHEDELLVKLAKHYVATKGVKPKE